MEEYLNIINFCPCSSSTSFWFRITFLIMSLYCLFRFSLFIRCLRFQLRPSNSTKTRKKPHRKKKKKKKKKKRAPLNKHIPIAKITKDDLCVEPLRVFTDKSLTNPNHFRMDLYASDDSLGRVIKGQLLDTKEVFIIRQLRPWFSLLCLEEFVGQVSLLSRATHKNLTKVIGYSAEDDKPRNLAEDDDKPGYLVYDKSRYLVYENVSGGGILENHLFDNRGNCLDWKTRMKIIVGVARALNYLHNDMKMSTVDSYIHPTNIWLDENWNPKLSAYRVVRLYYSPERVRVFAEKIGYLLKWTKKLTFQADIYGFGILLFEIITGRRGRIIIKDDEFEAFTDWVKPYLKDRQKLAEIADSRLQGKFNKEEFYEICNIAEMCLEKQPGDRPCMADLVTRMEHLAE